MNFCHVGYFIMHCFCCCFFFFFSIKFSMGHSLLQKNSMDFRYISFHSEFESKILFAKNRNKSFEIFISNPKQQKIKIN